MWSWRHTIHARVRRHRWQMRRSECPLCWLSAAGRPARHVYGLCIAKSELSYKSLGVAAHDVELHGSAQCEARTVGVRSSSFLTARAGPESPTFNPLGAPASKSCKRQNKAGTHGHLRHHVAEDFKGLMHCPVHTETRKSHPAKPAAAIPAPVGVPAVSFQRPFVPLFRQAIHFKIALRSNAECVGNTIEESEHRSNVDRFSDLRLGPTVIPKTLHIFAGGAIRRLCDLGDVIKQCTFRRAQSRLIKFAVGEGLHCLGFCSLNTQEVCM